MLFCIDKATITHLFFLYTEKMGIEISFSLSLSLKRGFPMFFFDFFSYICRYQMKVKITH